MWPKIDKIKPRKDLFKEQLKGLDDYRKGKDFQKIKVEPNRFYNYKVYQPRRKSLNAT